MVESLLTGGIGSELVTLQSDAAAGAGVFLLLWVALILVVFAGMAKTFQKAGQPWWGAFIPIYNVYLMLKIAGRPAWWLILFLIPLVNFVVGILLAIDIAKAFGKGAGFGIGLAILGFIFFPILGFGDARYQGAPN